MKSRKMPLCGIVYPIVTENNRVKCVFLDEKDSIFALDLLWIKGETRRMFIRNEIVETEEFLREFVAPNPISCGRFLNPKSEGLPKSLVGLNSLLLEVRSGILKNIQLLIVSNNNSMF